MTARAMTMAPTGSKAASKAPEAIRVRRGDDRRAVRDRIAATLHADRKVNLFVDGDDALTLVCRIMPGVRGVLLIPGEAERSLTFPSDDEAASHAVLMLENAFEGERREFRTKVKV